MLGDFKVLHVNIGKRKTAHWSFFVFGFNHTAYKLYSLWHVGYLLDDFYAYICALASTCNLYNPARCPGSTKPPQLSGSMPSYFPCVVLQRHFAHSLSSSTASLSSFSPRSSRSMSHESALSDSTTNLLPTSVFSMNSSTSTVALSPNRILTFP